MIESYSSRRFVLKFILLTIAFALGIITVANLRKPSESDNIVRNGIDLVVALDVSKSMLATDLSPNRLERAKQMILKLMENLPNSRIALILFAGRAYIQTPLTTDHSTVAMLVSVASPESISAQGTAVGEALKMSDLLYKNSAEEYKTVVLITDGEDHDEKTPDALKEIIPNGIVVYTVGIGSPEGAPIPDTATKDYKRDATGNVVISKLNEQELKNIAQSTKGIYVHYTNTNQTIEAMLNDLSQIKRKNIVDTSLLNYDTYYFWFAGAMLLLLVVELFLPDKRKLKESISNTENYRGKSRTS